MLHNSSRCPALACVGSLIGLAAVFASAQAQADVISDWNQLALTAITLTPGAPPPPSARNLAMLHTAMYNAISGAGSAPLYGGFARAGGGQTDPTAAAAQAAHDVMVAQYPTMAATFDTALASQLAAIPGTAAKSNGIAYGASAAAFIRTMRAADGSTAPLPYTPSGLPGRWVPTGSQMVPAFNQYCIVTPWAMTSPSQFRPAAPPEYMSPVYTSALNQVRATGGITSAVRTPEQTQIALLWAAQGGTVTPPGMWNQIAEQASASRGLSIQENARLFALLNIALADAAISAWEAKTIYDTVRPISVLRATDPSWNSLVPTPQFQGYMSGHSTFSAAAATVLAGFFGSDLQNFTASNQDGSITRSFTSFSSAAAEAGMSRIYGGIHFSFDNTAGLEAGAGIGSYVLNNALVPGPGAAALLALGGLVMARRRR